ncbi:alpha/beta hydrolase [Enterococcus sp. DIV0876]|uniref:alpha/beta hydrolase n=1 Tax=Enterococcus sp. DIV0876 TaxID=2774633 RepID=UPI003D30000B
MTEKRTNHLATQNFIFGYDQQTPLKATLFRAKHVKGTILYFHGGGFLYGYRNDLPKSYLQLFLTSGYSIFTFDYPLAPEASLMRIYQSTQKALQWFLHEGWQHSGLGNKDYVLFGRSAGGYLVSLLTATQPQAYQIGLIRFYGYQQILNQAFFTPSPYYQRFPTIPPLEVQELIQSVPLTEGSLATRFPLYLSARQFGNWHTYLGKRNELRYLDQQLQNFKHYPPTFLAHCQEDPDVPIQASKTFAESLPCVKTEWLSDSAHDFDRQQNPTADYCYQKLIEWLDQLF